MNEYQYFWNQFPGRFGRDEILQQVVKIFQGKPIALKIIHVIVANIRKQLDLNPRNHVLNLYCGNRLLAQDIAISCKSIIAMDYLGKLIDIADALSV